MLDASVRIPDHGSLLCAVLSGLCDAAAIEIASGIVPPGPTLDIRFLEERDERWQLPHETKQLRTGDCEDLVIWRVGSLRASGEDTEAMPAVVQVGRRKLHCVVRRGDGNIEDVAGAIQAGRYSLGAVRVTDHRTAHPTPVSKAPPAAALDAPAEMTDADRQWAAARAAIPSGQSGVVWGKSEVDAARAAGAVVQYVAKTEVPTAEAFSDEDIAAIRQSASQGRPKSSTSDSDGLVLVQEQDGGPQFYQRPGLVDQAAWGQGMEPDELREAVASYEAGTGDYVDIRGGEVGEFANALAEQESQQEMDIAASSYGYYGETVPIDWSPYEGYDDMPVLDTEDMGLQELTDDEGDQDG